jgi:hypothetical protein
MRSAAGQIWGHLPSGARPEVDHRRAPTTSQALWPGLASTQPKQLSYDERRQAWTDHILRLSGLVRRKS